MGRCHHLCNRAAFRRFAESCRQDLPVLPAEAQAQKELRFSAVVRMRGIQQIVCDSANVAGTAQPKLRIRSFLWRELTSTPRNLRQDPSQANSQKYIGYQETKPELDNRPTISVLVKLNPT